jgi:hypothetical protein
MILSAEQFHQTQEEIQTIWQFLESAREAHTPLDYQRLSVSYLLRLQELQEDIVEYLSWNPTLSPSGIRNDVQLDQAQQEIQRIWQFLEAAREAHTPLDYQRLATPYLLQLQERQQEVTRPGSSSP